MTTDDPPRLAYAVPAADRVAGTRLRRLLATASIVYAAVNLATAALFWALWLDVAPSRLARGATWEGYQAVMAAAELASHLAMLVGGVLLWHRDGTANRTMIRIGAATSLVLRAILIALRFAATPSAITFADRLYIASSDGANACVAPLILLGLSLALPPLRDRPR